MLRSSEMLSLASLEASNSHYSPAEAGGHKQNTDDYLPFILHAALTNFLWKKKNKVVI